MPGLAACARNMRRYPGANEMANGPRIPRSRGGEALHGMKRACMKPAGGTGCLSRTALKVCFMIAAAAPPSRSDLPRGTDVKGRQLCEL